MIWWRWPGHLSNTCRLMYDLGNTDFRRWRLRCKHKFSGIRCLTAMSKVADSLSMSVPYRRSVSQCLGLESPVHQILLLQWRSSTSLLMIGCCHFFLTQNGSPQQMIKAFSLPHPDGFTSVWLRQCSKRCGRSMQGAWRSWPRRENYKFQQWNRHEDSRNAIRKRWCLATLRKNRQKHLKLQDDFSMRIEVYELKDREDVNGL